MVDVSILIVSFNTCAILRECLHSIPASTPGLGVEIIVVDNASFDGSLDMVRAEFPAVKTLSSKENLGFGRANNLGLPEAAGRYVVMLNSDAFLAQDCLRASVRKMDANARVGLAGGQLFGRDGTMQPSSRMFPNVLRDFLTMSGLAHRFARSRFFGQGDRTWADLDQEAEVDWVPGAYSIIRRSVLEEVGFFDPDFFLYYEEVDLCRRIKQAGYKVMYWPELKIVHIGGESARQVKTLELSKSGAQLILWRMRSTLLFYRKHYGLSAAAIRWLEVGWYQMRALRNAMRSTPQAKMNSANHRQQARLMNQAWSETRGGRVSPPQPW